MRANELINLNLFSTVNLQEFCHISGKIFYKQNPVASCSIRSQVLPKKNPKSNLWMVARETRAKF